MHQEIQSATINNLPDEVLAQIFSYFSPKLLKLATLVCTRWNEIIGTSQKLMKHFKLNLTAGCLKSAINLNRKFQAIHINSLDELTQKILSSHKIKSLELSDCDLDKILLSKALQSLKVLENLSFDSVRFHEVSRKLVVEKVELNFLKNLSLTYSDEEIFNILSATKLETFFAKGSKSKPEDVIDFLKLQPSLLSLKLDGIFNEIFKAATNFTFALKCLKISSCDLTEMTENFIKFLKSQKSLQELTLKATFDSSINEFVLREMIFLTSLQTTFKISRGNELNFTNFEPLPRLKRLKLRGILNFSQLRPLLDLFPSLESLNTLNLTFRPRFLDDFELFTDRNLNELHCDYSVSSEEGFGSLREFHVTQIKDEILYNSFLRDHAATLEVISIKRVKDAEFTRSSTVDAISNCSKIKLVSFTSESPVVTKMFNKISRNHPWSLESNFTVRKSFINGQTKKVKIVFKFPDDFAVFHEHCRIWDDDLIRELNTSENYGLNAFVNKFK